MAKDYKYYIEKSKSEKLTLAVNDKNGKKIYLHSKFKPEREVNQLTSEFENCNAELLIILGMGLAYQLNPLKKTYSKFKKILIIDILNNIETELSQIKESNWLINTNNISIITGKSLQSIEKTINENINFKEINRIKVIEHAASLRVFADYYISVKKIINSLIQKKVTNEATINAFGTQFFRNSIKRLKNIGSYYPVNALKNKFKNKPALIISSAPSLDYYINYIKENSHKFIIIAVDSALPVLKSYNIDPDFYISIDPQPWIYEHIIHNNSSYSQAIISFSAYNTGIKAKHSYLSLNSHPLSQTIEHYFPDIIGSIDSKTGNVAGDAISAAFLMGCNPIFMTGIDFSFPEFNIYARGTAYQQRYTKIFNNKFLNVETFNSKYIRNSSKKLIKENKFTRHSFLQYKQNIEKFIKKSKESNETNIYNLYNNGFKLNETTNINNISQINSLFSDKNILKNEIFAKLSTNVNNLSTLLTIDKLRAIFNNSELIDNIIANSIFTDISDTKREKYINYLKNLF